MNVTRLSIGKVITLTILTVLASISMTGKEKSVDPDLDIENRVLSLSSVLSIKYTDEVKDRVYHYIDSHKKISATLLGRINIYFPLFESVLREKNMPEELKYLAVLESGLVPTTRSRVGAAGLWQFMKPTAELVGLKITSSVDERKDPVKSTYAAVEYLQHLYEKYNDWTLALAAYNCGEGNVNKAIKKAQGSTDYWELQQYLPGETKMYIPKFIAIKYMMNYYYLHDIEPKEIDKDLIFTATIRVKEKIDLKELAKELDIDFETIKDLNPSYLKFFIPKSDDGSNYLTLPESKVYAYLEKNNSFGDMYFVSSMSNPGDTKVPSLTKAEDGLAEASIRTLELPLRDSEQKLPKLGKIKKEKAIQNLVQTNTRVVKLDKGQSLNDLAKENGVELASIIEDNDFSEFNPPKNGDLVKIRIQ